ncbi:hypothetical protein O6H91_23G067300 [Diphasiastrum complanatum]|uniref:Uncharacterized protein n=1 Tax=Diphasiastrum complanatum TaxID=34168 RepID=A0ACC2ACY8_DIPCM|nr:hypothetical protein O6H91_23G067300 [Diphasiastrum complanatum]
MVEAVSSSTRNRGSSRSSSANTGHNDYGRKKCEALAGNSNLNGEDELQMAIGSDKNATKQSCKVAVIGAGAAGLVAARELQREGHEVVVYEEGEKVGGVWLYNSDVEDDPLGLDPNRCSVHSSMYASLRTNLPRELMGYLDYPFLPREGRDVRRFPRHEEVASYLQDFAEEFNLLLLVKFCTKVEYVGIYRGDGNTEADIVNDSSFKQQLLREGCEDLREDSANLETRWVVRTRERRQAVEKERDVLNFATGCEDQVTDVIFDAVVICNGHYSQPRVAWIPGLEKWPGKQMHSHNYRIAEPFRDKVVVVIGNGPSGIDISLELISVAKEVHFCAKKWDLSKDLFWPLHEGKLQCHLLVELVTEDGTVHFQDGISCHVDVILHCTGYLYSFPFLDTHGIVTVENSAVGPLFEHVFPPLLAPSLSFVGLPFKLQSKWIACILSKSSSLPSTKDMMADVQSFEVRLAEEGIPKHYTHNLDSCQFEYDNWLAAQCGSEPIESWRIKMYKVAQKIRKLYPDSYRDIWDDYDLLDEAQSYLLKLKTEKHWK